VRLLKKDPAKAMQQLEEWADPPGVRRRVVEREAAEAEGKLIGQARANLPTAIQSGETMIRNIDAILGNENLSSVTGPLQGAMPSLAGSSIDLDERIKQLQGQAFLQAFQSLRGGGQITEAEGAKASAAIARLQNQRQSDDGYRAALEEARQEIHELMNLARRRAGQREVPYQPFQSPKPDDEYERRTLDGGGWVTRRNGVRIRRVE
jgi:hypothetical protein